MTRGAGSARPGRPEIQAFPEAAGGRFRTFRPRAWTAGAGTFPGRPRQVVGGSRMSDRLRNILRKVGRDDQREREQEKWRKRAEERGSEYGTGDEDKTEVEKRHDRFRRQQEYASRLGPAAERLPILTQEERERREKERPKRREIKFEGPIEKLIEKYKDPKVVFDHLSIGQMMKYELDEQTGCIYEKGKLIFDGTKLVEDDGQAT